MLPEIQQKKICDTAIALKSSIEVSFLELGKMLWEIKQNRYYEPYWQDYIVFLEDMKLSDSHASRLISIYQKFILEYGFAPEQIASAGGWTVVAKLLPVSTTKKKAKRYLQLASNLTRKDLDDELREEKNGICDHEDEKFYTLKIYDCGYRERVDKG